MAPSGNAADADSTAIETDDDQANESGSSFASFEDEPYFAPQPAAESWSPVTRWSDQFSDDDEVEM